MQPNAKQTNQRRTTMSKTITLITLTSLAIALGATMASAGQKLHTPPSDRTAQGSVVDPNFRKSQGGLIDPNIRKSWDR
jgi:hypothetical protein